MSDFTELVDDWNETAKHYRGLASLDRVKQRGQDMEFKYYAHMLEACADELETLINDKAK